MHQCIFWGCILAVADHLSAGLRLDSFRTLPNDQMTYVTYLFGFPLAAFNLRTLHHRLSCLFHGLDIAAFLVLGGIVLSLWRRMRDRGAQTVQSFAMDFFPIILLVRNLRDRPCADRFAGVAARAALQLSCDYARDHRHRRACSILPFGKFFHIFQRPAQLGVKLYQRAGEAGRGAMCARCGERFASAMHVDDLKPCCRNSDSTTRVAGPVGNWQELCPACKRKIAFHAPN